MGARALGAAERRPPGARREAGRGTPHHPPPALRAAPHHRGECQTRRKCTCYNHLPYCPRRRWSARRKHHLKCPNLELAAARIAGDSSQRRRLCPHGTVGVTARTAWRSPRLTLRPHRSGSWAAWPARGPSSPSRGPNSSRRDRGLVCASLSRTPPRPQPCETLEAPGPSRTSL